MYWCAKGVCAGEMGVTGLMPYVAVDALPIGLRLFGEATESEDRLSDRYGCCWYPPWSSCHGLFVPSLDAGVVDEASITVR